MNDGCISCARGLHFECKKCRKNKCHNEAPVVVVESQPQKKTYKDPESTGRKRAAKLYPIDKTQECEWKMQKNCGGGRIPIVGCLDGKQTHRHHGPVKNPLRNHLGNVHRICSSCHVRYHELNDVNYSEADAGLLPHDPEPASHEEVIKNEMKWVDGTMKKIFVLKSSLEGREWLAALSKES